MKGTGASAEAPPSPIILLLGPPGSGKTTLGRRACRELGLEFLDLGDASGGAPLDNGSPSALERLSGLIADPVADVIELPSHLQQDRRALVLARRSGVALLLWAHPEDMQSRSGHAEPLFTPTPGLGGRGGFGRKGTRCREFHRLHRACEGTLLLVDLSLEEAAGVLRDCIAEIRAASDESPAEREGLADWEEDWRHDHGAPPRVSRVIIDAMARYLSHLRAAGCSPRTLAEVHSDLNAAGHLVLMYDAPKGKRILECFDSPPWEIEFAHKFTDSPAMIARYGRTLEGFARFLRESGDVPSDGYDRRSRPRGRRRRAQ